MSTIKVNGERTDNLRLRSEEGERGGAFAEIDPAAPEDAYGLSKWEAECSLHDAARGSAMETVVLRAPLLYGAGVKGNLHSLLKLAATGIPLPLGSVRNRRSLLYRGNLVDVIVRCVEHPAAANELFVLSDGQDLSTADLLRELRRAMGMPPRLVRFPPRLLRLLARLSGKAQVMDRLLGSLAVDSTKVRTLLSWRPRYSVQEGLREMVGGAR
jgi:nucleoside-diphosphate-sugar epimerase